MANGQQGFSSFDDLDKFLKQKPAVSSQQPTPLDQPPTQKQDTGGFKDFSTFDSFISETDKKKKQPTAPPPAKYGEIPFMVRPLNRISKWGEDKVVSPEEMSQDLKTWFETDVNAKDPRIHQIWKDTFSQIDPVNHPLNFLEYGFHLGHRGAEKLGEKMFLTNAQQAGEQVKAFQAYLNEPSIKNDPERKKFYGYMLQRSKDQLNEINKRDVSGLNYLDPGVLARAELTTVFDWEAMGAIFKPMEVLSQVFKDVKAARMALYAVNQAIGADFSWDSFNQGRELWKQGKRLEAVSAFGGAGAMLFMPLMGHVATEKGITQEQIRKKANDLLEEKKKEVQTAQQQKPDAVQLITPQGIEDMQYRIANGLPMMGIGRPEPRDIPMPDRDVLNLGEQNLRNRLERENAKGRAQQRVGELERQQQEIAHKKKIAAEQAKTDAEKRQLMAELDAREKTLNDEIKREQERFKVETAGLQRPVLGPTQLETPPGEPKKPFEAEPLELSPGSRPMTREEREDQWLEERRKRYTDELAAEREQRLREGQEFRVEDRRRFGELTAPPGTPGAPLEPPPGEVATPTPETAPAGAAAPLAPPPQTRGQIQDKIAAAAWENEQFELRKAKATTPEEVAELEKRQEENRKLAGDLAADMVPPVDVAKIGETMEGRKKPQTFKAGEALSGPVGKSSELKTVTRNYPIRYMVMEGAGLKTSHDSMTFEPTEGYPEGVQERDYQRDKDAQLAVIQHTQGYDPDFTLSDNPGPENGPPMVMSDGTVLGGNSRAMSTMRLYREGGGEAYKNALLARASQLGLKPEEIQGMKEPVLVREFLAVPNDIQSLRALGSDLNKVFTRRLSEFEQAVSAGKRLSPETLDYILQQLQDLGEGASLRDLLRERSKGILEKLEADGVIASTERRGFIDEKTDTLNEAGKDFVENAILGSVVDDPLVLANSPRGVLRKIERSLSSITKIKARGGAWDVTDYLKEALREHIAAASKGASIADHINPPTALMFPREPIHPIVEGIALKLEEDSAAVKKAFSQYSEDADLDVKGQGTMAFYEPPTPWKSFSDNFGIDVKPQEWGTVKAIPTPGTEATGERPLTPPSPVAPLTPPPSIGEIFDEEVERMKAEGEVPPPFDLGEVELSKEGSPSERFRVDAEKAFPKVSKDQMDTVMSIMGARARSTGKSLDKWIEEHKLSVESEKISPAARVSSVQLTKVEGRPALRIKTRKVNAEVEFFEDGRTIIRAFEQGGNATIASLVHELGHIFRRDLSPELLKVAEDWAEVKDGKWTVKAEEKFARGFERYLHEGKAPTEGLRGVFERLRNWMIGIYGAVIKSKSSLAVAKLNPEIREMFDRMLAAEPEKFGEREAPKPLETPPVEAKAIEPPPEPPKRREIEIPESGPKKRYEVEEPPRRSLEASIRAMTDDDVRTAARTIESQMRRPGITAKAREFLEKEFKPFRDEMERRNILDKPEKGFGENNITFTRTRADSARERLRTRFRGGIPKLYQSSEERFLITNKELVRDASEVMGYYFEGGIRDFDSLAKKMLSEFGESVRPALSLAYSEMLNRGRVESKTPEQRSLFEPVRQIVLPPGVEEVRRAPETKPREERPPTVAPRKEPDAGTRPEGRAPVGRPAAEASRPTGGAREPASGRGVGPTREGLGGGGVVEEFKQPLRAVTSPKLDVDHITDIPQTVEAAEWKARLKDANLPENLPPPTETLSPQVDRLLAFKGQPEIVQTVLTSLRKYNGAIMATSTGTGKCLAPGTPVLMFDGTIKKVEEIRVGDRLMGPDSKPRRVLSLAYGLDEMYRVTPVKGDSYEVNEAHILSVKMTVRSPKMWGYDGKILNLSVPEYLSKSRHFRHCAKGYRVGVDFSEKENPLPPYFMGIWLGDGSSHLSAITTMDSEVIAYVDAMAEWFGLQVRVDQVRDRCPTYVLTSRIRGGDFRDTNIVQRYLRNLRVLRNKHIPLEYKVNSREKRLELLAGLIDADGSLDGNNGYDLVFKQEVLAKDVVFVARSLGFAAYMHPCKKTCTNSKNKKAEMYYRIYISGDVSEIPVRIRYKKASPRKQKKNVLMTGITVKPIGRGEYYGFEIDGDGLFLLGDFTVTHNTYMGAAILAETRPRMGLIVAPSQNIAQQWIDTAEAFGVEIKPLEKDIPTEPGIYTTTYSTATNRKGLDQVNWNMVIADESHFARRWHDPGNQRGKFLVSISKNSDKVLYASATPFHTPLELGYFDKLGLWKKTGLENWLAKEFGVRQGDGGKWIVPMNYRKLAALRDELINRGMFVNLDRNMEGYSANFAVVPVSPDTMNGIRNATQAFRMAEEYFLSRKQNKMVMAVRGNAATFMKSFLERQRLPEAIELGKKLEKEGWKVIYFTESKKEVDDIYNFLQPADEAFNGAISEKMPRLPGVVDTLQEAFGDDLADFTGAHSARRQEDLDDFNRGGKKHLVATYGAGGVGVSLHDLAGDAPRAVIYLGPPWSGVMFDQAIGRPWRFGTKSNVAAYFLTSNAQPEMKLIFQKVLPRFESLKASVSGIKKADPIVGAMKDLDAYLAYEFGNDTAVGFDQFMNTVQTSAVSSYKEVSITSADGAKNKGMKVERRQPLDAPPAPPKLYQSEPPPPDLPLPEDSLTERDEKSASLIRRPFVSEQAEREITDPRLLDSINDENMAAIGLEGGGEKPPRSPSESIGNRQIPRPGDAEVRRDDLAAPKVMQRVYEFAERHFGEWGIPVNLIDHLANAESAFRLWLDHMHTSPYVLRQFPETKGIADGIVKTEQVYKRDLGNMQYEKTKILQENNLINDPIGRRKVDQALRLTDQGTPLMSLLGEPSRWLDGSVFKENELKAAQAIRSKIYEPVIEAVREVRPDVGYRRKYSAVIRTMEDLVSNLYPELNGKVPADLVQQFSLDVRRSMTRDPFSPHILKRRGEPPKTWDIDDVMEAYLPGMLRVKHYTELARKTAKQLAELPDSNLKEYSAKYARIFFGVPSEYKRLDRIRYKMARDITNLSYASALELNPLWFTMHLTKVPVNTFPELGKNGGEYLMKGYGRMRTEEGRELVARSGLLMDRLWASPETLFELKRRPQGWLRLTTSMSDFIDRSASYLAALEKAKDMGFLGPKEEVGDITWKRLNELAANGVDVEKAFDYAGSVMARSEFLYTPGHVQMWQREHPILGMFKHYIFREAEFVSTVRKIAKEVKNHPDPEAYVQEQVAKGNYEYIDAVAKYRRLLISLSGAAAVAAGIGGPLFSRFWPFHMSRLLSAPVMFAAETMDLMRKTMNGDATEKEWKRWAIDFFGSFTPYAGFATRAATQSEKKKKRHREDYETFPAEKFKFDTLPQ